MPDKRPKSLIDYDKTLNELQLLCGRVLGRGNKHRVAFIKAKRPESMARDATEALGCLLKAWKLLDID